MYSWKSIRTACIVLLLLPIVHLTYLISRSTMETLDNSPNAWAREIDTYAATDSTLQMPANPIVVVGGRRVKLWRNLEDLLAPRAILMRGLGDAIIEDITFNYTQLIGFYRPDTLVLLPGNSEFHLRDNKSAQDLTAAIRELVKLDGSYDTTRRVYIFTPVKTLLHPEDYSTIDQVTELLQSWAAADNRVVILDANPLLSGPEGRPRGNFFLADGINLNDLGYLRLAVLLRQQVEDDAQALAGNNTTP
jgi:hypothetical protein